MTAPRASIREVERTKAAKVASDSSGGDLNPNLRLIFPYFFSFLRRFLAGL